MNIVILLYFYYSEEGESEFFREIYGRETINSNGYMHQFFILDLYERKARKVAFYHQNNSFSTKSN